jgi:hypothetical protein
MLKFWSSFFFPSRLVSVSFSLLCLFTAHCAMAQVTALSRQLDRVDVAVSADTVITKGVAGSNTVGDAVAENASTTVGALVQVRYTKSSLIGFEGTYSYARFNETFVCPGCASGPDATFPASPFAVQTNASEYTVGYVAHLPSLLGFQTFAGAGGGSMAFRPTPLGGQNLPSRARLALYYDVGAEDQLSRYFGIRAQFRQVFYKAPDFGATYLALDQRTITSEPSVGFYIKF